MTKASANRLVLVATASPAARAPVRRYRLARLDLREPAGAPGQRFEHLKRVYD